VLQIMDSHFHLLFSWHLRLMTKFLNFVFKSCGKDKHSSVIYPFQLWKLFSYWETYYPDIQPITNLKQKSLKKSKKEGERKLPVFVHTFSS
jgi:hypothetical protein